MSEQERSDGSHQWREMRDTRGKLYARIDERSLLLEVRRNHESEIFDLRDYLDVLRNFGADLDQERDIE